MNSLPPDIRELARRLAAAQGVSIEEAVKRAVEASARASGVISPAPGRERRMTVDQMLAVGREIGAMPLLDPRSPREIMDDVNAP